MTNAIETLCDEWLNKEIKTSPKYESILEKYGSKDCDEYFAIAEAVGEEQKAAFYAGFRTAIQLIIGSMN